MHRRTSFSILFFTSEYLCRAWESEVTTLWPTIIEVVNVTRSVGGPEEDGFSEVISGEAIRKWKEYVSNSVLSPERLNDAYFHYQNRLFERKRKKVGPIDYARDSMLGELRDAFICRCDMAGTSSTPRVPETARIHGAFWSEIFGANRIYLEHELGFVFVGSSAL